jgi:hypothetical protein
LYAKISFFDKKRRINSTELVKVENTKLQKSIMCTFTFEKMQVVFIEFVQANNAQSSPRDMEKIAECSFEIGELVGSKSNKIVKSLKDVDII